MIELPRPRVLDIGSWPEGANPWDGADVDVTPIPEDTFLSGRHHDPILNVTAYPGCSSLYEPNPAVIDRFSQISTDYNFKVVERRQVCAGPLDGLGISQVDLIKLDVQGSELDILTGGQSTLSQAVAAQVEVEFLPLYKHQPTAGEVFAFMEDEGFYLHQLRDCGGSPFKPFETARPYLPASQLLYADAVFIRDINNLTDDQRLRLISVLWNIYRSYDLAIHLADPEMAAEMLEQVSIIKPTFITMKADTV